MEKQTAQIIKVEKATGYVIVAAILFIALFAMLSVNKESDASRAEINSASSLSAAESMFDFGTVPMKDGKISHKFEVSNNGAEAITIQKVYTSCMCTEAFIVDASGKQYGAFGMQGHVGASSASVSVDPGSSITVEAVFDPAAHGPSGVGLVQRSIYLETNSLSSPKLELSFKATVTR